MKINKKELARWSMEMAIRLKNNNAEMQCLVEIARMFANWASLAVSNRDLNCRQWCVDLITRNGDFLHKDYFFEYIDPIYNYIIESDPTIRHPLDDDEGPKSYTEKLAQHLFDTQSPNHGSSRSSVSDNTTSGKELTLTVNIDTKPIKEFIESYYDVRTVEYANYIRSAIASILGPEQMHRQSDSCSSSLEVQNNQSGEPHTLCKEDSAHFSQNQESLSAPQVSSQTQENKVREIK